MTPVELSPHTRIKYTYECTYLASEYQCGVEVELKYSDKIQLLQKENNQTLIIG